MVPILQALHDGVDQGFGIFVALVGEVEIDHGGFEVRVTEISLDDAQVDSCLQQVSGIAVAQGMDGDSLFADACLLHCPAKGTLDAALCHGLNCCSTSFAVSSQSREDEGFIAMGCPVLAQEIEGGIGQRDIAILGALSSVNVDHHSRAVDVADLQIQCFMETQSAGVDSGEIGVILEGSHPFEDVENLLLAQDGRKPMLNLCAEYPEDMPVTLDDMPVKETYPAIADAHSVGSPLIDILPVKEIEFKLVFRDQIRLFPGKLDEHPHSTGIGPLRGLALPVELQCFRGSCIPLSLQCLFHDTSPFSAKFKERYRDKALISLLSTDVFSAAPAAYLNNSIQPIAALRLISALDPKDGYGHKRITTRLGNR